MALPTTTYDIATATNPSSALTDFTFIVDLSTMSSAWWDAVDTSDGTKGRASKSDGTTELACDWIDFDNTLNTGFLYIKYTGTLASTGTQEGRIYPPMAANASYAATDTYGSQNAYRTSKKYFNDFRSGVFLDRTSNANDPSEILGSPTFDSTGVIISDDQSIVFYPAPITTSGTFCINVDLSNCDNYTRLTYSTFVIYLQPNSISFTLGGVTDSVSISNTTWQTYKTFAYTYDSSGYAYVYANGAEIYSGQLGATDLSTQQVNVPRTSATTINGSITSILWDGQEWSASESAEDYSQILDNATFWGTWTNVPVGSNGAISGTSTGESTASGVLKGSGILTGSSDGTSNVTATIKGAGKLLGLSEGDCTVTGTLTGTSAEGNLHGNISGTSTVSGTLTATGKLSGEIAGTCVVSGTLIGKTTGELSGLSEGTCTVTGNIYDTAGGAVGLITITLTASSPTLTITGSRPNINIQTGI